MGVVCGSDTWKVWGEKARLSTQLSVLGYPVITCPLSRDEHRRDGRVTTQPCSRLSRNTGTIDTPVVPDLTLPDSSLSRTIFQDLCQLHRNGHDCPGFSGFSDRMKI